MLKCRPITDENDRKTLTDDFLFHNMSLQPLLLSFIHIIHTLVIINASVISAICFLLLVII